MLDYLVIVVWIVVVVLAGLAIRAVWPDAGATMFGSPLAAELSGFVSLTLPVTLYFALTEASGRRASLGKRRMRLQVVTVPEGGRLSPRRSLLRSAVKFLPWELAHASIWQFAFAGADSGVLPIALLTASWVLVLANVGAAVFAPQHRAVHDLVAGSVVVG